ncbi:MAG TPA: YdeI/OmpD-associated family protein, partial [Bryobacteraceae bacterium]|nr:YdeI/OmpD-associated family protein [Bryobacteraceae bacterium]
ESEPTVPVDLRKALAGAAPKARALWSDITPIARRDWIHWITSAKKIQIFATLGFAVLYSTLVLYATGYDRGRFLSILTDCPLFSLG